MNVLQLKMLDKKLILLSTTSRPIESGLLWKSDFSDIISEFVKRKPEKIPSIPCFVFVPI